MKPFTNEERHRYYGLRVGDIINCQAYDIERAEVVAYGFMDNNAVYVQQQGKEPRRVVAEWCSIMEKVEDRLS